MGDVLLWGPQLKIRSRVLSQRTRRDLEERGLRPVTTLKKVCLVRKRRKAERNLESGWTAPVRASSNIGLDLGTKNPRLRSLQTPERAEKMQKNIVQWGITLRNFRNS